MFTVVLVEPQIPQNVGNIARSCAAGNLDLVLVGRLGFRLTDRHLKRAGLDYWEYVRIQHEPDRDTYLAQLDMQRSYILSSKVTQPYTEIPAQPGDTFIFGSETAGLPADFMAAHPKACYTIPMANPRARCLNLATSVGIVMFHALGQHNFGL